MTNPTASAGTTAMPDRVTSLETRVSNLEGLIVKFPPLAGAPGALQAIVAANTAPAAPATAVPHLQADTTANAAPALQVLDSPDPRHVASQIGALKARGLKAVILYISPINMAGDKTAKKAAIQAILAAGIDVGFVCEGWGGSSNFAHHDINAVCGTRDGAACGHWLDQLGAPAGTAVYPAVDNDAPPNAISQLCLPYFHAFREALAEKYRMGVYGCGALLQALDDAHLIDYRWLSNAMGWSGSKAYRASNKWDILQGLATRVQGIDIDPDQLNLAKTDFGFWKAAGSVSAPAAPDNLDKALDAFVADKPASLIKDT